MQQRTILLGMAGVAVLAVLAAVWLSFSDDASASGKDAPERAAAQWVDALFAADQKRLRELTCAEHQQSLEDAAGFLTGIGDLNQTLRGAGISFTPTDMTYEVVERSENRAVVQAKGKIKFKVLLKSTTENLDVRLTFVREQNRWKYCDVTF
jgi:hypothetical protein